MFTKPSAHSATDSRPGSLGHQFLGVLKAVFQPGRSRHRDKKTDEAHLYVYSKNTMRKYTEEAFEFAEYLKTHFPACRAPEMLTPEMCTSFINHLSERRLDGGTIGRYQAMIRKLDSALRHLNRRTVDVPPLLPTVAQGGLPGFRSNRSTQAYMDEQLMAILNEIETHGSRLYAPVAVQVIRLMFTTGLRIQEATYLRAENIDLSSRRVTIDGNRNRAKGGRPRKTEPFDEGAVEFMAGLRQQGERRETGHIFGDRVSLPNHVRREIRRACRNPGIKCLGSHGFRELNAQNLYASLRDEDIADEAALQRTSKHLGHNRIRDTKESYVPPQDRRSVLPRASATRFYTQRKHVVVILDINNQGAAHELTNTKGDQP